MSSGTRRTSVFMKNAEDAHSEMKMIGAPSTQSGLILLASSFLLLMHSLYILGIIDIGNIVMHLCALAGMGLDIDMDAEIETKENGFNWPFRHPPPLRVLIPLMSIPYLVWNVVKSVSLSLYLSN